MLCLFQCETVGGDTSKERGKMAEGYSVIEKYADSQEIDVPRDLFEEELNQLLIEEAHRAQYASFAAGEFRVLTQEEKKEAYEQLRKMAFRNVKMELLIKNIIETQHFEVTLEELEEEAKAISERQGVTVAQIKDFLGEDLTLLKHDLLNKKAERYMQNLGDRK